MVESNINEQESKPEAEMTEEEKAEEMRRVWQEIEDNKAAKKKAYEDKCEARSKIQMPKLRLEMFEAKYHTN